MKTIKVGCMPGKLQVLEVKEGETAREIFKIAGVEVSNHEIRLDGNKIDIDNTITNGSLLVAMKQIKGNAKVYNAKGLTSEEVRILLDIDEELPTTLEENEVEVINDVVIIENHTYPSEYVTVEKDIFDSVYTLEDKEVEWTEAFDKQEEIQEEVYEKAREEKQECACKKLAELKEELEEEIKQAREILSYHEKVAIEYKAKIEMAQYVLERL